MATKKTITLSVNNLNPTPGYILVAPAEAQKQTASGIYLPDSHDEQIQHGIILAVGKSVMQDGQTVDAPAKKGDAVVYKKWGGNEVKIGEIEYQFLKFEDILAIIK
jgi:chaperonin GroES